MLLSRTEPKGIFISPDDFAIRRSHPIVLISFLIVQTIPILQGFLINPIFFVVPFLMLHVLNFRNVLGALWGGRFTVRQQSIEIRTAMSEYRQIPFEIIERVKLYRSGEKPTALALMLTEGSCYWLPAFRLENAEGCANLIRERSGIALESTPEEHIPKAAMSILILNALLVFGLIIFVMVQMAK